MLLDKVYIKVVLLHMVLQDEPLPRRMRMVGTWCGHMHIIRVAGHLARVVCALATGVCALQGLASQNHCHWPCKGGGVLAAMESSVLCCWQV